MIRQATRYDKSQIIEMMKLFRDESKIKNHSQMNDEVYIGKLLDSILAGKGIIYIKDNAGFIMAIINPSIWDGKSLLMQELAWYVKPEFRNTSIGYRLLKSYIDYGKKLKEEGRISLFYVSKMVTSPNIKYEKFGFSKLEESWYQ